MLCINSHDSRTQAWALAMTIAVSSEQPECAITLILWFIITTVNMFLYEADLVVEGIKHELQA